MPFRNESTTLLKYSVCLLTNTSPFPPTEQVIKEVRAMAGLGLKEAKELVEGAPKTVMAGLKREEAEELAKKLEDLGATVEIA